MGARFPDAGLREVALVRAAELDARADPAGGTRAWLALEALQTTGSFKVRGALAALYARREAGATKVVAASAGNHGAGVAYAAQVLGMEATVVVPRTAPQKKRDKIASRGATLIVADTDSYDEAEQQALELATDGAAYVSAYDDVDVVLGNGSSLGFEIVRALGGVPERLLAPFGGGGLSTGLAWALAEEDATESGDLPVWGVQSEASCAMAMSLERGAAVERLDSAETWAEGLEGGISASAFARARGVVAGVAVVTEAEIAAAMAYAYRDLGVVVEGSAAVALVPLLTGLPEEMRGGDLVAVLTGRNVDQERLERALRSAR